jgi:hypothetical protein
VGRLVKLFLRSSIRLLSLFPRAFGFDAIERLDDLRRPTEGRGLGRIVAAQVRFVQPPSHGYVDQPFQAVIDATASFMVSMGEVVNNVLLDLRLVRFLEEVTQ